MQNKQGKGNIKLVKVKYDYFIICSIGLPTVLLFKIYKIYVHVKCEIILEIT